MHDEVSAATPTDTVEAFEGVRPEPAPAGEPLPRSEPGPVAADVVTCGAGFLSRAAAAGAVGPVVLTPDALQDALAALRTPDSEATLAWVYLPPWLHRADLAPLDDWMRVHTGLLEARATLGDRLRLARWGTEAARAWTSAPRSAMESAAANETGADPHRLSIRLPDDAVGEASAQAFAAWQPEAWDVFEALESAAELADHETPLYRDLLPEPAADTAERLSSAVHAALAAASLSQQLDAERSQHAAAVEQLRQAHGEQVLALTAAAAERDRQRDADTAALRAELAEAQARSAELAGELAAARDALLRSEDAMADLATEHEVLLLQSHQLRAEGEASVAAYAAAAAALRTQLTALQDAADSAQAQVETTVASHARTVAELEAALQAQARDGAARDAAAAESLVRHIAQVGELQSALRLESTAREQAQDAARRAEERAQAAAGTAGMLERRGEELESLVRELSAQLSAAEAQVRSSAVLLQERAREHEQRMAVLGTHHERQLDDEREAGRRLRQQLAEEMQAARQAAADERDQLAAALDSLRAEHDVVMLQARQLHANAELAETENRALVEALQAAKGSMDRSRRVVARWLAATQGAAPRAEPTARAS